MIRIFVQSAEEDFVREAVRMVDSLDAVIIQPAGIREKYVIKVVKVVDIELVI